MARKSRLSPAILKLIAGGSRHAWSLEELQADLADAAMSADFSSVFRAAEKLVADGVLRKLLLDDGRARFELAGAHHDHLHCRNCGTLIPVRCVIDRRMFSSLEAETGIAISTHRIMFSGLCQGCRSATLSPENPA
jgi:Fur family ferric uptake transcriptional regulator